MAATITVVVNGLAALVAKVSGSPPIYANPVRTALTKAALDVEGGAKRLTPRDTARLQASITSKVDSAPVPRFAEVGTNVKYGRFVHEGRRPGRMPPPSALAGWARRHGMAGAEFQIARAIGRKGIKGKPFLKDALESARGRIQGYFNAAAREVEGKWRT